MQLSTDVRPKAIDLLNNELGLTNQNANSAYLRQLSVMIQRSQGIQLLKRNDECFCWRGVHEIKVDQIIDAQAFQQQHHISEICSLDL